MRFARIVLVAALLLLAMSRLLPSKPPPPPRDYSQAQELAAIAKVADLGRCARLSRFVLVCDRYAEVKNERLEIWRQELRRGGECLVEEIALDAASISKLLDAHPGALLVFCRCLPREAAALAALQQGHRPEQLILAFECACPQALVDDGSFDLALNLSGLEPTHSLPAEPAEILRLAYTLLQPRP